MNRTEKVAANLRAFRIGVNAHDRENPEPHPAAYGVGLVLHDLERLGFDDGEELWPGIRVEQDAGVSGNFRVLCGAEHGTAEERVDAVSRDGVHA